MTNRLPSACGLGAEESSENGTAMTNTDTDTVDVDTDSIVDKFADITVIDPDGNWNSHGEEPKPTKSSPRNSPRSRSVEATHIIVLVHGWMGNPAEMGYIRESIQNAATAEGGSTSSSSVHHRFVLHSAVCNEDKTDDGIAVGGSRLAQEINDLVRHVVNGGYQRGGDKDSEDSETEPKATNHGETGTPAQKFTLSIVGNSLGGLYARHALAGIHWDIGGSDSSAPPAMLIPMVFVTTATPHLGISQHTYVPLPRAAEFVVAQGMKETGRDFFQFTPVLEDLFCKDYFLNPLSSFQQRIAYINVYGTDFQVPTATAAFWAPDSDSPHYRVRSRTPSEKSLDTSTAEASSASLEPADATATATPKAIVMTLTTPRRPEELPQADETVGEEKKGEEGDLVVDAAEESKTDAAKDRKTDPEDVFTSWSKRLDRLGWTKVLVDVREDVPGVRESIATAIDGSSSDDSEPKDEDDGAVAGSKLGSNSDSNTEEEAKTDEGVESGGSGENAQAQALDEDTTKDGSENEGPDEDAVDMDPTVPEWTKKDTWTAGELLTEFKGGLLQASSKKEKRSLWDLKPRLPLGHTVMIANAKDAFNKKVTSGGKPVMDYLGASLVRTLQESVPSRNSTESELYEC